MVYSDDIAKCPSCCLMIVVVVIEKDNLVQYCEEACIELSA